MMMIYGNVVDDVDDDILLTTLMMTMMMVCFFPPERTAADPTTATPRHNFAFTPSSAGDTQTPWITAMVSTQHGRLVMADYNNSKVKVCDLTDPYSLFASRQLEVPPFGLALLSDGLVAVTTGTKTIYLLGVGENRVSVKSRLETERVYVGVAGNSDDTLVVSCGEDGGRPSRVDVITRRGHVVRTVIDGRNLSGLEVPDYLCVADGQVWISDFWAYTVHKVELTTGRAECSQTHTYMKNPRQVAVDRLAGKASGSVYVASYGGQCVMARTGKGEWRRLLHGPRHSLRGYDIPCGVCSTDRGLVVAWCNEALISDSVVIGYDIAADMGDTP